MTGILARSAHWRAIAKTDQSVTELQMSIKSTALVLLTGLLPLSSMAGEQTNWIDLTHELSADSVYWPTAAPFRMTTDFEGTTDNGYYYSAYSFTTAEHGGTHIDAPVHFAEGANPVDEIPLEQLIGEAVVIDVTQQVSKDRDHQVSVADLEAWEAQHGAIPHRAIVLLKTGFGQYWPNAGQYLGTDLRGEAGVAELSFPGLGTDAATWLMENRQIKAVGIDTASIDHGKSTHFETHVALMRRNVPAFENVANLDRLPATGVWVVALPVKIRGGSGGPLRIVARIHNPDRAPGS
jgi:kynurenine formamidase